MSAEKGWWTCSICGPATHSSSNWCDGGCGSDYQKMTKLVPETDLATLREQLVKEIEASKLSYIHEDAIRLEDGTWPGLRVIPVEDVLNLVRGKE